MTNRLYYGDPYEIMFEAAVIDSFFVHEHIAVILDSTFFYPTSGGQPHDTGKLNDISVVDVFVRESDQKVVHLVETEIAGEEVVGRIDWSRRFDHMQQHSGQHILSRAFINVCKADTVGFHLGKEVSTIDLDLERLDGTMLENVESLANQIVWENHQIISYEVSPEEAKHLALRKVPESIGDKCRLIDIKDFDLCACGGTHVAHSGEIGVIKVTGVERRNNEFRIEFICGQRALDDYQLKTSELKKISLRLTTGFTEIDRVIELMQDENKDLRRKLKRQKEDLLSIEARSLKDSAIQLGNIRLVKNVVNGENPNDLRMLASKITRTSNLVVLLGKPGVSSSFVFAASDNIEFDMNNLLQQVFAYIGDGKGGGSMKFAQGGGLAVDEDLVVQALNHAENLIRQQRGLA